MTKRSITGILRAAALGAAVLACVLAPSCTGRRANGFRSITDLGPDARIGVLTGMSLTESLQSLFPEVGIDYFEDLATMCIALKKGRIDALACMRKGCESLLSSNPAMYILDGPVILDTASVAFRPEDSLLCGMFNDFLARIRADGTFDIMHDKWFPGAERLGEGGHYTPVHTDGEPFTVGIEVGQTFFTLVVDNEETGFEPELMSRFADFLGRKIVFSEMTGTGMVPALKSGRVDALVDGITPTDSRSRQILFSDPYDISPVCFIAAGAAPSGAGSFFGSLGERIYNGVIAQKRYLLIFEGLYITLVITLFSVALGFLLGALLCWAKRRGPGWLKRFSASYCELIERIPIVVLLLFMFYVVFASTRLTGITVAIITFSLHFAAGAAEILEHSISAVDKGQWEAGTALGFTRFGTFRYVIVPQALGSFIQFSKGKAIALIENTAIVGFIAIKDMTKVTDIIRSQTYESLVPLAVVAVIYFLIATLIGAGLDYLGDRLTFRIRR